MTSFRSVIELWDTREALATAIGAKPSTVSHWWQRNFVPPEWWCGILKTRKAREAGVTADLLASLAARRVA